LLKELHAHFGASLELLIFPCDQFGNQELPEAQVGGFCSSRGVPTDALGCHLMAKVDVNGPSSSPVWTFCKAAFPGDIKWNFDGLFVIDKSGQPVLRASVSRPPSISELSKFV